MIDVENMNVQVEILGAKEQDKYIQYGDEVVGWAVYRWAMYRCSDLTAGAFDSGMIIAYYF